MKDDSFLSVNRNYAAHPICAFTPATLNKLLSLVKKNYVSDSIGELEGMSALGYYSSDGFLGHTERIRSQVSERFERSGGGRVAEAKPTNNCFWFHRSQMEQMAAYQS